MSQNQSSRVAGPVWPSPGAIRVASGTSSAGVSQPLTSAQLLFNSTAVLHSGNLRGGREVPGQIPRGEREPKTFPPAHWGGPGLPGGEKARSRIFSPLPAPPLARLKPVRSDLGGAEVTCDHLAPARLGSMKVRDERCQVPGYLLASR